MRQIIDGQGRTKLTPADSHNAARRSAKARQRAERHARAQASKRTVRPIIEAANLPVAGKRQPVTNPIVEVAIRASDSHSFLASVPASWIR